MKNILMKNGRNIKSFFFIERFFFALSGTIIFTGTFIKEREFPTLIDPSLDIVSTLACSGGSIKLTQTGLKLFEGKYAFNSKLIGRDHSKSLPDGVKVSLNQGFIRTGWSNAGSQHIFRTSVGHKGSLYHRHIDWFKKFILFPLFPIFNFRRTKRKIEKSLGSKIDLNTIYDDIYIVRLLEIFINLRSDNLREGSNIIMSKNYEGYYIYGSFYSEHSISINISHNTVSKEMYLSIGGSPNMEGNIIYEYDKTEKHFFKVNQWFTSNIREKLHFNYDNILRYEYIDINTGEILHRSTEIRFYWKKITKIETKDFKKWI